MAMTDTGRTTAPAVSDRGRLGLLATTVVGHAIKHFFNAALYVLVPEMKPGLDLNNSQVGLFTSVRNLSGGLSNLPAGFIADRLPAQRAIILGLTLIGIGISGLLMGITTNFAIILVAAVLFAGITSFWHPAAIGALSRQFADRRGFAIALHGSGGSVGEALGPLAAGFLLGAVSWQLVYQGMLVPGIVTGLAVWLILRAIPVADTSHLALDQYVRGLGKLFTNPRLLLVLLFAGGFSAAQSVVTTFLPIYLRETVGVSTAGVGFYLFLAQVVGIGSQPVMGHFSDHWGRKQVLVPALLMLAAAYGALYFVPEGWPFLVVVIVMGAFLYSLMAIFLAAAADLVDSAIQSTTVSLVFGVATATAGIGPGVAGVLADSQGIPATFLFAAAIVLMTGLIAAFTRWNHVKAPI